MAPSGLGWLRIRVFACKIFKLDLRDQGPLADLYNFDCMGLDQLIELAQRNRQEVSGVRPRNENTGHSYRQFFESEFRLACKRRG